MLENRCIQFLDDLAHSKEPEAPHIIQQLSVIFKMMNHATFDELHQILDILNTYHFKKNKRIKKSATNNHLFSIFSINEHIYIPLGINIGAIYGIVNQLEKIFFDFNFDEVLHYSLYGAFFGFLTANFLDYIHNTIDDMFKENILNQFKERITQKIEDYYDDDNDSEPILMI
ncbi:MAG TPA: hypothetical protein VHM20_07460 [Gammaproteobacteria bacterium]|jgi:hypothetical protein|nr:hypothetical protein [Gammaproteobacteria bacterium]